MTKSLNLLAQSAENSLKKCVPPKKIPDYWLGICEVFFGIHEPKYRQKLESEANRRTAITGYRTEES
uniref:Uncharacterized protein n=1 Tax=Romanomermis culicivorax TaxID=13658 RepID=A0A915KBL9_ROMCU